MRHLYDDERGHHRAAKRLVAVAFAILAPGATALGCTEGSRAAHQDASNPFACNVAADCDDHIPCTVDNCGAGNICSHTAVDATCTGAGEHCVLGVGCTTMMSCTESSMCDDGIPCTVDTCNVGNVCGHQPVNATCTDPAMPVCDVMRGCVAGQTVECTTSAQCDDGVNCTLDTCGVNMMCSHMALDSLCGTSQHCDAIRDCIDVHPCTTAADCMDPSFWNFCDGTPVCMPEFGCTAPTPRMCDDGNHCTTDVCDRNAGANGACSAVCDRTQTGCESEPVCAVVGPSCSGTFAVSPSISQMCVGGMVHYGITQIQFTLGGGMLILDPDSSPSFGTLTDAAPACPSFSATAVVLPAGAGVTEYYTLSGTFTDDDHFTGTWVQHFVGPGHAFCPERSYPVSGTRI
ncbi:MAG: hypothetical protein U0234_19255 [Sandaracinus sp.]